MKCVDELVADRRLARRLPLSNLSNATLGIDAGHFLATHVLPTPKDRVVAEAVGGFPLDLEQTVTRFISVLRANEIRPLFVFDGLTVNPCGITTFSSAQDRTRLWNAVDGSKGSVDQLEWNTPALSSVSAIGTSLSYNCHRQFLAVLARLEVSYMVAPYSASAQLAYLSNGDKYVDAVYGTANFFLYGAFDKLISMVDTSASEFDWVSLTQILADLNLPKHGFVAAALASGDSELNSVVFPPVEQLVQADPSRNLNKLRAVAEFSAMHSSVMAAVLSYMDPNRELPYGERMQKCLAAAQLMPVLKDNGKVEPAVSEKDIPTDLHDFVGQRLPDELELYLSKGLVGVELIQALSSAKGTIVEQAPFDGGESVQYRELLRKQIPLRSKALSFLSQTLHRYYQFKAIKQLHWYEPNRELALEKLNPPCYIAFASSWKVPDARISGLATLSTAILLNHGVSEEAVAMTFSGKPASGSEPSLLSTDKEILINAYLRALHAAGAFEMNHALTKFGLVLAAGVQKAPQYAEQLLLAWALIQHGVFAQPLSQSYGDSTSLPAQILCRVGALLHSPAKPSILSRSMLAFQSLVALQTRTLRYTIEAALVSLLANRDGDRLGRSEKDSWASLTAQLPFSFVPTTAMALEVSSALSSGNKLPASVISLWAAVYAMVVEGGKQGLVDTKVYEEANALVK